MKIGWNLMTNINIYLNVISNIFFYRWKQVKEFKIQNFWTLQSIVLINILMGTERCLWVRMDAYGCIDVQKLQNYVIWTRGGAGMHHDLGIPGGREISRNIMAWLILPKKIKQQAKPIQNINPGRHKSCIESSKSKHATTTAKNPRNQQNSAPANIWQNTASAKCHW